MLNVALKFTCPNQSGLFSVQQNMGSPAMVLETVQEIPEATQEDLRAAFDYTASYYLGLSGDEFLRRLDANQIQREDPQVKKVLRRINLVRPEWVISSN